MLVVTEAMLAISIPHDDMRQNARGIGVVDHQGMGCRALLSYTMYSSGTRDGMKTSRNL